MSLLRNARRQQQQQQQQQPVVVVHPRHPELCLGAPSHASSHSDHRGANVVEQHQPHHHQQTPLDNHHNHPSPSRSPALREELLLLRQGRPAAAHALPLTASPLPPPLSAPATGAHRGAGRAHQHQLQPQPTPPLLLRSCAPGGRPATSCFCNVTTLYD